MECVVRRKKQDDCKGIASVITIAWNETYIGIVPDSFLNDLYKNEEERAYNSFSKFNEQENHEFVLEVDGKIVGFVKVGTVNDDEYNDCGELHSIYLLKEYSGKGYGKKLFGIGVEEIKKMGYNKMIVGCLDKNVSNNFYKHMGGRFIKTRIFKKLNLLENVYLFENI